MHGFNEEVFFYDEKHDTISSLTRHHAEYGSIGALVEAHPKVIYFYATLVPWKDWDFNEYALSTQTKEEITEVLKNRDER